MMRNKLVAIICATVLTQAVCLISAQADFIAYNDCVGANNPPNTTIYSAKLGGGGGFETPSGLLKNFDDGILTSVTATLAAYNVSGGTGVMPNAGTPANNVFSGKVDLSGSASCGDSTYGWYYQVTFTGLNVSKEYEFVTTANRGSTYSPERWAKFSIIGADNYTNASSTGVVAISGSDVLKMNTGANTVAGNIIRWTGITAADGSFTVKSENLLDTNGKPYGYGMQAFMLAETSGAPAVPIPGAILLLGAGMVRLAAYARRRRD